MSDTLNQMERTLSPAIQAPLLKKVSHPPESVPGARTSVK
jgi:hypothetical protein